MNIFYLVVNFIQGITEFLPVSSSGHIILLEYIYGVSSKGLEAFLHLPTAIAMGALFYREWIVIAKNKKFWPIVLIALVPAGLVGLLFGDYIDAIFYTPIIVAFNQILWGAIMIFVAYRYVESKQETKELTAITLKQAIVIGVAQILALFPGTSRSGITTLAGISQKVSPNLSATFSFLIGFPVILAAAGVGLLHVIKNNDFASLGLSAWVLPVGFILSFFLGFVAMKLFTSDAKTTLIVLKYSGYYRLILGGFILLCLI